MTLYKTLFCANDQSEQKHALTAAPNGEVVATCELCGRALKFPAGMTKDDFIVKVSEQKDANVGQVSQESIEAMLSDFADAEPEVLPEV